METGVYVIHSDRIEYKSYNFYFSSLHKSPIVTLDRITAVDTDTFPHSLIIDNREVIFLNHRDERLKEFAERNKLSISSHIDTWELLVGEYLDTEYSVEMNRNIQLQLNSIGFSDTEIAQIRKDIKAALFGTWEWQYLGLWDLLAMKQNRNLLYRFLGKEFYWKVMKIALRGSDYTND